MSAPTHAVPVRDAERIEWERRWASLRARRIAFAVTALLAPLVGLLVGGALGVLLAVGAPFFTLAALYACPCPRCHQRFTGERLVPMPEACVSCGAAAFDNELPSAAVAPREPGARASAPPRRVLAERLRRTIAVSQIIGGVLTGLVPLVAPLQGTSLAGWYVSMLEGVAFAGVMSGIWLWRDEPAGYRITRLLLAAQVVRWYGPAILYDVRAGLGIVLHAGDGGVGIVFDVGGQIGIASHAGTALHVGVNVLALVWLIALAGAGDGEGRASTMPTDVPAA